MAGAGATGCGSAAAPGGRARSARKPIVIVGGGIAGLSAAWRLAAARVHRLRRARDGGARRRQRALGRARDLARIRGRPTTFPIPGPDASALRTFFRDLGVLEGDERGASRQCASRRRSALHSRALAGGTRAAGGSDRARPRPVRALRRTDARVPRHGRVHHSLFARTQDPCARARDCSARRAVDGCVARREGFDSPYLRWWVEYGCRDDYGALACRTCRRGPASTTTRRARSTRQGRSPGPRATAGSSGGCSSGSAAASRRRRWSNGSSGMGARGP